MSYEAPRHQQQDLLKAQGTLLILAAPVRPPKPSPGQPGVVSEYLQDHDDVFVAVSEQGWVRAFNGHVDLGTGIQTALSQIVADELDVPMSRVQMVLGHTDAVPNQGPTIASASIQIHAVPLRKAAAQARQLLLAQAAQRWELSVDQLKVVDGTVIAADGRSLTYWQLLEGQALRAYLDKETPTKAAKDLRIVGTPQARVDIPGKVAGQWVYVHDVRVPGMLHGRVVRPPYVGRDSGDFVGCSLESLDEDSIRHIADGLRVVVIGDFVGVVAHREEHAIRAARELKLRWKAIPPLEDMSDLEQLIRRQPKTERLLADSGPDFDELPAEGKRLKRSYIWPFQLHASIGPSCAVADYQQGHSLIWSGTQNPHMLRVHLSQLLDEDEAGKVLLS